MSFSLVTVFAVGCIQLLIVGQLNTFEFLEPVIMDSFNATSLQAINAGSAQMGLHIGTQFLSAFVVQVSSGDFIASLGFVLIGSIMWFLGIFCATLAQSYEEFLGIFSVLTGIGGSIVYWQSLYLVLSLPVVVKGNPTLVYIVAAFGALGDVVLSFALTPSMTQAAWRNTYRVFGIVSFSTCISLVALLALLGSPAKKNSVAFPPAMKISKKLFCCKKPRKNTSTPENSPRIYWLLVLSVGLSSFAMTAPKAHIAAFLRTQGLSELNIEFVSAVGAVGTFCGKILPLTWVNLVDSGVEPLVLTTLANVLVILLWVSVTGFESAMVFSFIHGVGMGAAGSQSLHIAQQFGVDASHLVLIPMTILGFTIGTLAAGPLFGAISESCGLMCAQGVAFGFQGGASLVGWAALTQL
jgi:MFS family permease